jgi:hypothetical protein
MLNIPLILEATDQVKSDPQSLPEAWIRKYTGIEDSPNQFLLFLKPEVMSTEDGVNVRDVLQMVNEVILGYNVTVGAIRTVSGVYLSSHRLMDAHYGVINAVSRLGLKALSSGAQKKLDEVFGDILEESTLKLGGHQFLTHFPTFSGRELAKIVDGSPVTKLAGGTYASIIVVDGEKVLVLNGFHPAQLEYYYRPSALLLLLECHTHTSWRSLRHDVAGATNPKNAAEGSIRRLLLVNKNRLGIEEIDQGRNGVHLSAGPLEGFVELRRFLKDFKTHIDLKPNELSFGKALINVGMSDEQIASLCENPLVMLSDRLAPAFDVTEELDVTDASTLLASSHNFRSSISQQSPM